MPKPEIKRKLAPLPLDHPNLIHARGRLHRIQIAWAVLFIGAALLTVFVQRGALTTAPIPWLAAAILLLVSPQPAYLALVATLWGLSLIGLNADLNRNLGIDPIGLLFDAGTVERLALAFVRVILLIMAWNQFLFYRLLYGTERAAGLDPGLRPIPEMVANRTDRLAVGSSALAGASLLGLLVALAVARAGWLLSLSASLASLGMGLGIGAAFSPTNRRPFAVAGVAGASLGYLLVIATGGAPLP